ncbi:hypothetical protein TB2_004969 [Malus domestica]
MSVMTCLPCKTSITTCQALQNVSYALKCFKPIRLGAEGSMKELSNGLRFLTDGDKGLITFDSLKRHSALLGFHGMSDEELWCMLREGDLDGDGNLNEMEFCTLMFRLSPALMETSKDFLEEALACKCTGILFYRLNLVVGKNY